MPWKETNVLDLRTRFIAVYLDDSFSMAELCRDFGISRKTGYKLVHRYENSGPQGLYDLSRAAHHHPNAIPEALQEMIIACRTKHPTWGPRKLLAALEREHPTIKWPVTSTIGAILNNCGLAIRRKRRLQHATASITLTQPGHPNDVWCADFKGHFVLGNHQRCHPFTITDAYSRSILRVQALSKTDANTIKPLCVAVFREYGLPSVIRTDNGPPFASTGLGGLSALSIWWIKLGIRPERIKPAHPEQNGQHERMHRTLKEEATTPPQYDIRAQQRVFDRFRDEYNYDRPHQALGQATPASVYTPSPRPYPLRMPDVDYPSGMLTRHVRTNGTIRWRGSMIFVSETLVGEYVALDQLDDRYFALYYGQLPLAILDDHTCSWLPAKVATKTIQSLLQENRQ
jgi:transposase InsO family protein